jgi:hypothetical protein
MRPCAFCQRPADSAEHVFDDWLNYDEEGRTIKRNYTVVQTGLGGEVIRTYKARVINPIKRVVCDECNNGWMSDITNAARHTLYGCIWHERPATLLRLGILAVVHLAFLKAAVIDFADKRGFFSPGMRQRFFLTLQPPDGTQVWIAWFRSRRVTANYSHLDGLTIPTGRFRGFEIAVYTYVVGHFAIQLTCPVWCKPSKRKSSAPIIVQAPIWDRAAIPIWPHIDAATWPTSEYLTDELLETFRERFRNMHVEL